MDTEKIRALAEIVQTYGLTSLDLVGDGSTISLRREAVAVQLPASPAPQLYAQPAEVQSCSGALEIKAPMVGTFYAAPSPDAQPFIRVGSKIRKGDTLCILEAMKLMNEINAEAEGEIIEICVSDGDIVEYGQTIFKYITD